MPLLKSFYTEREIEAGCDEAGRGCLAGPVFAAAVVLSRDFAHPLLNDSKLVSEENRTLLRTYIEERALAFCVARVDEEEIDRINILKASFKAMHLAIDGLGLRPGHLLIDGNRFIKYQDLAHTCIIKGDSQYASIAAASILAKTYRDEYMLQLHESFPHYGWRNNKGYGTAEHRRAIGRYGLCRHHRKTFQCRDTQLSIELE